jgi:hypothetical protein
MGFFNSQTLKKIKIVDSEQGKPIANVRIFLTDEIIYSNEDGIALLPNSSKNIELTSSGYETKTLQSFTDLVKLKPIYNNIDEVTIKPIDFVPILTDINKNYSKRYYSKPTEYDISYKQKNKSNDSINFLFLTTGKFWSKENFYNRKDVNKANFNDFAQLKIEKVQYLKSEKNLNEYEMGALDKSFDFIGNFFFSYDFQKILFFSNQKNSKSSGRLVSDKDGIQTIAFKIQNENSAKYSGTLFYNKVDKVITHFEVLYDQSANKPLKRVSSTGETYEYRLGNGGYVYDFIKINGVYFPAFASTFGYGFVSIVGDKKYENSFQREVVFNNPQPSAKDGLSEKIDFTKRIWENIPEQIVIDNTVLLSTEEQNFINQNLHEKED